MNRLHHVLPALVIALMIPLSPPSLAHSGGIKTAKNSQVAPAYDIVHTRLSTEGNVAIFHMAVSGKAGASKPARSGKLAGSTVFSYVWPTSLNSALVGFDNNAGILALAVTAHPDFDDTPWFDENGDGDLGNDGDIWHSHWVVLQGDNRCGDGALKVVDIPNGAKPKLPATWPGLPILIDSPGWSPTFAKDSVEVRIPFADIGALSDAKFDGVTAALRVNANIHDPLLCVVDVFNVASGDLSLPGRVNH